MAIAVVQSVPSAASLDMLVKFSADPALSEDAFSAMMDFAGRKLPGVSAEARRAALQAAMDKSTNDETKKASPDALECVRDS